MALPASVPERSVSRIAFLLKGITHSRLSVASYVRIRGRRVIVRVGSLATMGFFGADGGLLIRCRAQQASGTTRRLLAAAVSLVIKEVTAVLRATMLVGVLAGTHTNDSITRRLKGLGHTEGRLARDGPVCGAVGVIWGVLELALISHGVTRLKALQMAINASAANAALDF